MKQSRLLESITKTFSKKWFYFQDNDFGVQGKYRISSIDKTKNGYVIEVKLPLMERIKDKFKSKVEILIRHSTYKVLVMNDTNVKQRLKVFGINEFDVKDF